MTDNTLENIAELLAAEGNRAFAEKEETVRKPAFPETIQQQLQEIYQDLEGIGDWQEIPVNIPAGIQLNDTRLVIDDALHFNRYRAITLRAEFYESSSLFNLASYKRYCRAEETACLKQGKPIDRWTSRFAEAHFGKPSTPGDFFHTGSPAWRLRAFQDTLSDAAAKAGLFKLKRVSVHDRVLSNGQLQPLGSLLLSRTEEKQQMLKNFLLRTLGLPLSENKGD